MASETYRRRFTEQLIVMAEKEMADRVLARASQEGVSKSDVLRDALQIGLDAMDAEDKAEGAYAPLPLAPDTSTGVPRPRRIQR